MNVGTITTPTNRGQIVIPADFRETLRISDKTVLSLKIIGGGIFIQPMVVIPVSVADDGAYLKFLREHRGFMASDEAFSPGALKARRKLELARAKRLKKAW